jgi:hypothetical protein
MQPLTAEDQARRKKTVTMAQWVAKFDAERLRRAAIEPTSDFDKIVDEVKQLEAPPPPAPKPKKPGRKKKDGGE